MTDDRDGPRHMIYDISRTVGHGRTKEVGTITKVAERWSHMLRRVGDPIWTHGFAWHSGYDFATASCEQSMFLVGNVQSATQLTFALIPLILCLRDGTGLGFLWEIGGVGLGFAKRLRQSMVQLCKGWRNCDYRKKVIFHLAALIESPCWFFIKQAPPAVPALWLGFGLRGSLFW